MRGRRASGLLVVTMFIVASGVASAHTRDSDEVYERANQLRHHHHDGRALNLLRAHFEATNDLRALAMPTTPWADMHHAALVVAKLHRGVLT